MVDASLIMSTSSSTSPLVDLTQAIHLPSHRFLLVTSSDGESPSRVKLQLFAPTPVSDSDGGRGSRSESAGSIASASGSSLGYIPSIITWTGYIELDEEVST